jgi:type I restriction enzyme S subunit
LNTDKNKILPIYLFYFLSNEELKKFVMKYVTKSTISGINNENLNNINILVPPIELQKRYEITIELIQRSININIEEKFVSSNLFNSLLQKAFNGELVA